MSFDEKVRELVDSGIAKGVSLVDANGNVIWSYPQGWHPPVNELLKIWKSNEPGITIEGVRFSVLERYEDRLTMVNVGGQGGWVLLKSIARPNQIVIIRIAEGVDLKDHWTDIARLAEL